MPHSVSAPTKRARTGEFGLTKCERPGEFGPVVSRNGSSIRSRVLAIMDDSTWQTIKGLASKSNVAAASVRGVVYAPNLQDRISKQKKGKTVRFKLKKGGE